MSDTEFDNAEPDDTEAQDIDNDVEDGDETGQDEAPKPKPPADKKPDATDGDPFTPPSEAEWRKTQAALKKANEDAKRNRFRAKELEEQTRANETDHEKALREAREEGEKRFRAPLVKAAARAALSEAGLGGSTDRVMRLLDLDALTVDDDGDVVGLDGEVARVKDEYPEFFQTEKPRPRARPTAADRKPVEEKPRSSAERHAMKVLGRTG
ncbi:phage scaffolding protein [Streptomyces sp. NBC_01373]|uniref:phage scaffolding protein n=1 Tax=Streptomyces sp. NBC_01373 TaxID=2903843 RepID=UPI0022567F50|nr:phage scaffolding protein [Streptomyces sp. NBC_01373]MCX4704352.1 phage scaffolding protein [Streptomyces sp. NBC_01373]MCX4707092.1 phage scaffolding protein [Streptomyces sp. NBC_01373]